MGSLWNRSGTIERYADDLRAAGAKAYFMLGGTTTPMTVYEDAGEAGAYPSPVVADANGRWPDIFVPYIASYDVRVTTAVGFQLTYTQNIPNPNPVEVIVPGPPGETIKTGQVHFEFVASRTGYVRLNGKTIGNDVSGATERNNIDTLNLFTYLWENCPNLTVSGGRGGAAASDFSPGNKNIQLPDFRGAMPIGLDTMGAAAAAGAFPALTPPFFTAPDTKDIAGSATGVNAVTLTASHLAGHSHSATTDTEAAHTHTATTGGQSIGHTHTGTTSNHLGHAHAAFIRDPQHTHTRTFSASVIGPGSQNASGGANTFNTGTLTIDNAATGVRVNSVSGGGAGTDDATAAAGAHGHTFTSDGASNDHTHSLMTAAGSAHSHGLTITAGVSTPFNNLPRCVTGTWLIKL